MAEDPAMRNVLRDRLRLGTGFDESERSTVIERLGGLEKRLSSFSEDTLELELSIKERDGADQRLTLECWMAGRARLVSTSASTSLERALIEVRDDMVRQITDATNRREPRNNRRLRQQR
jgi:hypothetical protein